jgi:hypothetical protein
MLSSLPCRFPLSPGTISIFYGQNCSWIDRDRLCFTRHASSLVQRRLLIDSFGADLWCHRPVQLVRSTTQRLLHVVGITKLSLLSSQLSSRDSLYKITSRNYARASYVLYSLKDIISSELQGCINQLPLRSNTTNFISKE